MNLEKFRALLIVALLGLSLGPLVAIAYRLNTTGEEMLTQQVSSHLVSMVEARRNLLDRFLAERTADLRTVAGKLAEAKTFEKSEMSRLWELFANSYPVYLEFIIADSKGEIVFFGHRGQADDGSGTHLLQLNGPVTGETWFQDGLVGRDHASGLFFANEEGTGTSAPFLRMATPIISQGGQAKGVLAADVDFREVSRMFSESRLGTTGEIYLIDLEGRFLTRPRLAQHDDVSGIEMNDGLVPATIPRVFEHLDYRGKPVLAAQVYIPDHGWIMMAEQDREEALALVNRMGKQTMLLLIFTAAGVLLAAWFASTRIMRLLRKGWQHEKELEAQVTQQDRLAAMGLLTAGIAHELNNPLGNALLYSQMLKEELGEQEGDRLERLTTVEEEIQRAAAIVKTLLEFSRQSRDTTSRSCNVNVVLRRLLQMASPHLQASRIQVVTQLDDNLPPVEADPGSVQQVFTNIVANAAEAMSSGGILEITSRHVPVLDRVSVEISNNGPVIPKEQLSRVFDPFFTTKPTGQGTGLGLFVTYGIVRRLGGTIRVVSGPGTTQQDGDKGSGNRTSFSVDLPACSIGNSDNGGANAS